VLGAAAVAPGDGVTPAGPGDGTADAEGVGEARGTGEMSKGAGIAGGDADGEAAGDAVVAATRVAVRAGVGDGRVATLMPQPASSIAAPAAATTLARHLGPTSASSVLAAFFAARARPPPCSGCRLPCTGDEETGDYGRLHGHEPRAPHESRRRRTGRRAVTPHVEDRDRTDLQACIAEIDRALCDLLEGRGLHVIAESTCSPAALPLARTVNHFIRMLAEIRDFVIPLSRGELSVPQPSPDNRMAGPLVEMHARLSQLTRQTQEVARGDYTQRIDFMGEFSEAFNSMVTLLEERERTLTDEIARRKQAEDDLQRERDLLVAGPVVTFRWDVDDQGTVQYVSPNISAYGYTPDEFTSGRRVYSEIVDPADLGWINDDGNDKARAGLEHWVQEYRIVDARGETHWIRDFTHAVRGADGAVTAYEGYIIDITSQKAAEAALRQREEQLRMLSLSDDLTGLYNRRGLFALGEHTMRIARRRARSLGIIYIDVESLKTINDRFGHAQGDEALRMVADVMRASIRESDVVGRVGGDEFVILAEDDTGVTQDLVARLRRRLELANAKTGRPFRLSLSIGAVDWEPGEQATLQELIERADQCMYDDKRAGRG